MSTRLLHFVYQQRKSLLKLSMKFCSLFIPIVGKIVQAQKLIGKKELVMEPQLIYLMNVYNLMKSFEEPPFSL